MNKRFLYPARLQDAFPAIAFAHDGFGKFSRHRAWRGDRDIRESFGDCAFAARQREIVLRSSPHCPSAQARERRLGA